MNFGHMRGGGPEASFGGNGNGVADLVEPLLDLVIRRNEETLLERSETGLYRRYSEASQVKIENV